MSKINCEISVITQEEARSIHEASLKILYEVGIKVEHEKMLNLLAEAGAEVNFGTMVVKFSPSLVEKNLQIHVEKFTDLKKSPEGWEDKSYLSTHIFCTNVLDPETDHIRNSTLKDLEEATIIGNTLPNLRKTGPLVLPCDVPPEINDAYMWAIQLKRSQKTVLGELLNPGTVKHIFNMCAVAAGSEEEARKKKMFYCPCFPTSPFEFSWYALDMAFRTLDVGMPVRFGCPMVVAGLSAPSTLAGTLTVGNAEYLAGVVMAEACGCGSFADMGISINYHQANGNALYASPEKLLMNYALRDMAKFYGYRSWKNFGGHANNADACWAGLQAGIEKGFSSMFARLSGDGWLHCGMLSPEVASIPQMLVDAEICDLVNRIGKGIEVNDETISYDLIKKMGIHGNYLDFNNEEALEHTVQHFKNENWLPKLFVRERPHRWEECRQEMYALAKEKTKNLLAENDPHPLGTDKEREIDKIMDACKKEAGC